MNTITYKINAPLDVNAIIEVFISSGIVRPVKEVDRIEKMFTNADLTISAWSGNELIGVSRSITDWCFCCYLSDLAVKKEYQRTGIGKEMIAITREQIGDRCMLLLLAARAATGYYPKLKMERLDTAFIYQRKK